MAFVALDRRFVTWEEKDVDAPARLSLRGLDEEGKAWQELRTHRRVVVLAEAGSGKTEEMRAQARELSAKDVFAFHAALEDVARNGLDDALSAERERLESWRNSALPAYFFIDSIDEAKLEGIRLETALRKLADGIRRAPRRAFVVLSGRVSDWEFRADFRRFHELLAVPADPTLPPPPSASTLLVSALRGGSRGRGSIAAAPAEEPVVVLMQPFDESRIRQFAQGKGVSNTDAFIEAIERADLWSLARRPLDLEWMVLYWQRQGEFGPLAAMLEASLQERIQESNSQHRLNDPISKDKALSALERVGAAMAFGRVEKIVIPDSEVTLGLAPHGMRLNAILPDWNPDHLRRLLGRAVFDPSTFGHVRLHNDNEGLVCAYLNAKWLHRRRQNGAPVSALLDLLFCETYGFSLVRPSMRQTAAWLALRDSDVAREVIAREPGLLLAEGDPGSLSVMTRSGVLRRILVEMAETGERLGYVPEETLRRFSTAELGPAVRELWGEFNAIATCRTLLLRIIGLGVLRDCADLAAAAVFGSYSDDMTQILGGRALVAMGDPSSLERYGAHIRDHAAELPSLVRWEALDGLFGRALSVEDFLNIVSGMDDSARNATLGLDYYGPRCMERITKRVELEKFLHGIDQFVSTANNEMEEAESPGKEAHLSLLAAASLLLMAHAGADESPSIVMDVALRIRSAHRHRRADEQSRDLVAVLTATPQRRRIAFWYVAEKYANHRLLNGRRLDSVWAMGILGWSAGLQPIDMEWILADVSNKSSNDQAELAMDAAMDVWQVHGKPDALLQRIQAIANKNEGLVAVVNRFLVPRIPSREETEHLEEMARLQAEQTEREATQQTSWTEFIDKLREDPDKLRRLPAPTKENIDARLYYLWELLSGMDGQSRYAIEDVRLVEPVLGIEVTAAFRDGLIAFWRQWEPTLESARAVDQRNVISKIDCMGICSVTVEAAANPRWASNLTAAEARRAAQFGTLELNGFPSWMIRLSVEWPNEVGEVLLREIVAELDKPSPTPHAGPLQDVENGASEIARTVAPALFQELQTRRHLSALLLEPMLTILSRGLPTSAETFAAFLLGRAAEAEDMEIAALYLAAAFHRDPSAALDALVQKLATLERALQRQFVEALLPGLFGDSLRDRDREPPKLPLTVLERLLEIAFRSVRIEEDITHEDGVVFSPGPRDAAESARGALFRLLRDSPGRATIVALRRLANNPDIPVAKAGAEQWCLERAAADSENSPWPADEAVALEHTFEVVPRTPAELQAIAIRRISDLVHDLHHGDSSLGDVFKMLQDENAVQRWIAQELRHRAGRAYSLEREPLVADENEPDIRLRSLAGEVSLPIEIKVAESWSLAELEKGLVEQLCGRYLRARGAKAGVYLIAHLHARAIGWHGEAGSVLTFDEVIAHLQQFADSLAEAGSDAPQARVCAVDVSDL
ncbi:MAG: hypothetical protein M3O26_11400 [Pseudomonadota bacterium]|nr:hypothetical protein [Pseudomonadota bacterium]